MIQEQELVLVRRRSMMRIMAMRMKANIPMAMAACFISNPFTNVPFWVAQIRLGQWLIDTLNLPVPTFLAVAEMSLPGVGTLSVSNFIVGFVSLGLLLALAAYPVVYLFSALLPHHLPVRGRKRSASSREKMLPES